MVGFEHEEWRAVVGAEHYLQVSSLGRVRSRPKPDTLGRVVPGKVLSPHRCGRYWRVRLRTNHKTTEYTVHILVLEAFAGPRPAWMHGCHNDGNTANNTLGNLRWDTPSENARDAIRHGTAAGAKNFKGATGMTRADGSVSPAAQRYRTRRKRSPEEQRAANAAAQRRYRQRKALAVTWMDQHGHVK